MRYEAFISYRHGEIDGEIAKRIHSEIENWRVPKKIAEKTHKTRLGRVFRDEDELQASADLSAAICEALDESEWLIVICTKRYSESKWCLEEVSHFTANRGLDHVIVILADGEPEEVFPEQLTHIEKDGQIVEIEPLAVDIRGGSDSEVLKNLRKERFRYFSSMLSVNYDDLKNRQRERRMKLTLIASGAALVVLTSVLSVIIAKNVELNHAYDALDSSYEALDSSMQDTLKGESYYLSGYADEAYDDGDKKTAIMLALQALPESLKNPERPYVSQAMRSLTRALGIYDHSDGFRVYESVDTQGETFDVKSEISPDGKRLLIERYVYAAGNILERDIEVYELDGVRKIFSDKEIGLNKSYYHFASKGACFSQDSAMVIYAGADALTIVNPETGEKKVCEDRVQELRVSDKSGAIVAIDYDAGKLVTYDKDGKKLINCTMGRDINYSLGQISPEGTSVALSAKTENMSGVMVMDIRDTNGDKPKYDFMQTPGETTDVRFITEKRVCFLQTDAEDGLKHIVYLDTDSFGEGYLCNTDWDIQSMALTDVGTCYYYHDNRVYEVDALGKKGKKLWQKTFSSNIASVNVGGGLVAVSCHDGSVSVFDEKTKTTIRTPKGDNKTCYVMDIDAEHAIMRDYWGSHIRIYKKGEDERDASEVKKCDLRSKVSDVPKKWSPAYSSQKTFAMGFDHGARDEIVTIDAEGFSVKTSKNMSSIGLESLDNLTLDLKNDKYILVQDHDYNKNIHYDTDTLEKKLEFSEDSYYYYDETGEKLYLAEGRSLKTYDGATGRIVAQVDIPAGYDRGVVMDDGIRVFSSEKKIFIQGAAHGDVTIDDAVLYSVNLLRGLIFYRNAALDKWYVYKVDTGDIVCDGDSGAYSCVTFFDNNRYLLNDYNSVYDMDTWEKVLDLSELSGSLYGVMTTDELPYFVAWCRQSTDDISGTGPDVAYLYDKESKEVVGEVPDFVTLAPDGEVVAYDGAMGLHKFRLYTASELMQIAKDRVGAEKFSERQKELYHLYSDK